ncbi:MAG TPA: DUF4389 domain-containing protein [Pseudonocardiaceae bacterium]|nr:DUF4389 domain-containing protein [Pseudonocardiaceae bacterium]
MFPAATPAANGGEMLPELEIDFPGAQRRLTVLLRILLLIPQFIILFALGLGATLVSIIGWFAALVLGRLPQWVAEFLTGVLAYNTRVMAYYQLLVDRYSPVAFSAPAYPVRVFVQPGRLNRLAVLFRLLLLIPAAIISSVLSYGWLVCAFFCWLAVLILGRTPRPLCEATAAVLRYSMRYQAYFWMLTSAYPKHVFGDEESAPGYGGQPAPDAASTAAGYGPGGPAAISTRPLVLSRGGRWLLIVFIVVGALALTARVANDVQSVGGANQLSSVSTDISTIQPPS